MSEDKKSISAKAEALKEELQPLADKYINLMLADLVTKGILEETSDIKNGKIIKLKNRTITSTSGIDTEIDNPSMESQRILDFRELCQSLYFNLNEELTVTKDQVLISNIVDFFEREGALSIPNIKSSRLRDILDKGQVLLNDRNIEIQQEAGELLDIKNGHNRYIASLLQYYVKEKVRREFPNFKLTENLKVGAAQVDLVGVSEDQDEPNVLFEVKYRKKALNSLKDDLFEAFDLMTRYDRTNPKDTCLVLIIFSDEGSDAQEKLYYRFKQYIEESFPTFSERIFLIALFIKNNHILKGELKKLKLNFSKSNSSISDFYLASSENNAGTEKDDHLYDRIFDLTKFKYELSINATIPMSHWRVGLKFSQNQSFPARENRHSKNYHLFHTEKNIDSTDLKVSYYGPSGDQVFAKSTKISNYQDDMFIFYVSLENNITRVDIVDKNRDSILDDPLQISSFPYFMLSAWADGRNMFAFKIQVKERRVKFPQGVIQLLQKTSSNSVKVQVFDERNAPITNCHVVLLAENNTYHEGRTSSAGQYEFSIPLSSKYSVLAAHENYLSSILEGFEAKNNLSISLKAENASGSIICPSGAGNVLGLEGRLNPILDTQLRSYLYADNIAIDGGQQQPVNFEINKPLLLEDKNGVVKKVIIKFIRGKTSVIDFF